MPNNPPEHNPRPRLMLVCALLATATTLLYAGTLQAPFVFDDFHSIVDNPEIKFSRLTLANLATAATQSHASHRWLPNLSFALNYLAQGTNVIGYHLVNICIHFLTGITAYLLFLSTLRLPRIRRPGLPAEEIAFLAALLWLVHPIQTNAVTYIVQRMTSMMTLFYLLSLLCYAKGRLETTSPGRRNAFFAGSLITGVMALFSKENAAMLPIMILAYEYFFIPADRHRKTILKGAGVAVFILALGLGWLFLGDDPFTAIRNGYQDRDFTLPERLLTEPRIVFHYLSLLALPLPSRLNINHDFPISHALLAPPQTIIALLGLAGLILLGSHLFKKEQRLASFAILWFLANLVIESTVIALELLFEHRLYLPSLFLFPAALTWLYSLPRPSRAQARAIASACILLLCILTWQRNTTWASATSLWADVVQKSPALARGHVNLGRALMAERQYPLAEQHLHRAMAIEPDDSRAYLALAALHNEQKRYPAALATATAALTKKHADAANIRLVMAIAHLKMRDIRQALAEIDQALAVAPQSTDAYTAQGIAFGLAGRPRQAEEALRKAIALDPRNGHAYLNLGITYDRQQRFPEAITAIETALASGNADQAEAHNNLGIIYWEMKDYEQSIRHAQTAIRANPELLDAYITLGVTLEDMGRKKEAFASYRAAWSKGYDMPALYNHWAEKYLADNNRAQATLYLFEALKLSPDHPQTRENLARAAALPGNR
ncbi:MAG: tetratricopeptide repeat protein [Desulfobulbaceae bacterium]|nr:tetratricopeptide repeat protein [Desulfobulbaceae bacterium]